jgi:hypothetical protein
MMRFKSDLPRNGTILCLGVHCDDIQIGCGGALIQLRECHSRLRFVWVIFFGMPYNRAKWAQLPWRCWAPARRVTVDVHRFRGSYYCGPDIRDSFEAVRHRVQILGAMPRRSMR